jgi:hypothetical protein
MTMTQLVSKPSKEKRFRPIEYDYSPYEILEMMDFNFSDELPEQVTTARLLKNAVIKRTANKITFNSGIVVINLLDLIFGVKR